MQTFYNEMKTQKSQSTWLASLREASLSEVAKVFAKNKRAWLEW